MGGKERYNYATTIKESIYIRAYDPTFNRCSQEHSNTLMPSVPRRSIVEHNTSCHIFTAGRIVEEIIPSRLCEAFL